MRTKISILFLILLGCSYSWSQSSLNSMFGKRLFVEATGGFNFNTILKKGYFQSYPSSYNTAVTPTSLRNEIRSFNTSYRASVSYVIDKRVSLALEFTVANDITATESFNSNFYTDSNGNTSKYVIAHETIDLTSYTFMPKVEISASGGIAPAGMAHQIGFGFTQYKPKERNYLVAISDLNSTNNQSITSTDSLFNPNIKHKGFTLLYSIIYRKPLSRSILLHFGLNYNINFGKGIKTFKGSDNTGYMISVIDLSEAINRARVSNLLSFKMGITFLIF